MEKVVNILRLTDVTAIDNAPTQIWPSINMIGSELVRATRFPVVVWQEARPETEVERC
jgi:hypothetical protein